MAKTPTVRQMFFNKTKEDTPGLNIEWDLSVENYIKAFDGLTRDEFEEYFPNGFVVGKANIEEIYNLLDGQRQIYDAKDLWKTADKRKTLEVIQNWYSAVPLTPPVLGITCNNDLNIEGGNHRFNVCRIYGSGLIVFLAPFELKTTISTMLQDKVKWLEESS